MSLLFEQVQGSLQKILLHCKDNCEYYHDILSQLNIEKFSKSEFENIPLLTKKKLVENSDLIRDRTGSYENIYTVYTSGTTGFPLRYDRSQEDKIREGLILQELRYSFKIPRNPIVAMFGLHKEPIIYTYNGNQRKITSLSLHNLSEERFFLYYYTLRDFKPDILQGYASVLYEFAQFIRTRGLEPLEITLVENRSEHLQNSQFDDITRYLGKLSNMYGASETYPIAYSCPHGKLHISGKNVYIEVVDMNSFEVLPIGQTGEIVVTSLTNRLTPIIRYRTGDIGMINYCECQCGNTIELTLMMGRTGDQIKTPNGYLNAVVLRRLFDHFGDPGYEGIGELQIIQEKEDIFTINLVENVNHMNDNLVSNLVSLVKNCLGYSVEVNVCKVSELERNPTNRKCPPFISRCK
ncbi:phenylacetate--CoA ligase family protein [Paenibacillus sp. PAMC 26794]|uniref:phenylacetate--CoA ligase family protein n=1 Tax=Paenibacillus sp. PAMC 26794 TaxID=1257080 RepID=UPI00030FE5F5|nr:phenylacetate--CoA ligase family protein [Paenibacillus sp. PAMC 26794]